MAKKPSVWVYSRSDHIKGSSRFNWGDFWVKECLQAALAMNGCHVQGNSPADLNVFCWGRAPGKRIPKQGINVAWFYSRPEQMTDAELDRYDLVFCTSASYVKEVEARHRIIHLPVCSHLFGTADPQPVDCPDVVFIGNARNGHGGRPIARYLSGLPSLPFSFGIWGVGWRDTNPYWRGRYYPFDRLQDLYATAKVVLIDHYPQMAEGGFLKHQVLDVVAAGGLTVVDNVQLPTSSPWPVYDNPDGLLDLLKSITGEPPAKLMAWRKRIAASVEPATFVDRAGTMIEEYRKRGV